MPADENSMPPISAPSAPSPPYHMIPESEFVYVFYDVATDVLEAEVPAPLEVVPESEGPRVRLALGDPVQPPHSRAPYHEGVVSLKVRYDGHTGWYSAYIWTHSDEAMDTGRLYGINKQICDNTPLRKEGNQVHGKIERYGEPLFEVSFTLDSPPESRRSTSVRDKMLDLLGGGIMGYKKVPSPEREGKVLRQVIYAELEDVEIEEIWEGNAAIQFHPTGKYPRMHKLAPAEQPEDIVNAFYVRPDFVLPHGEVLWEQFE